MDVRIDKQNEEVLRKLAQLNGQPTAASMVRMLIRDAAKEVGLWPIVETNKQTELMESQNGS